MVSANLKTKSTMNKLKVLILIILEDGFCYKLEYIKNKGAKCLNPYYTGRWFLLCKCRGWQKSKM